MSLQSASREPQILETTLADVVAAVTEAGIPERRRQEIASALRSIGRALNKPLERVPADPRRLSARLKEVAPQSLGLSPGRWNNIRALARAGVGLVVPMAPGRRTNQLTSSWEALWGQLEFPTCQDVAIPLCTILLGPRSRALNGQSSHICEI